MNEIQWLLIGLAALAAGAVNALAGGGTLISFPMLMAVGLPAVTANVTNTVALCPGYLGATLAQSRELRGQAQRLRWYLPAGLCGGAAGGMLLLHMEEQAFRSMVPFLILFASGLLAAQERIRVWLLRHSGHSGPGPILEKLGVLPAFLASVYGGYFGAGVSVIVLAVLGLVLEDSLTRLNALKQGLAFVINLSAAVFFALTGPVDWPVAGVMALGALAGGSLGGRFAGRIRPGVLRWTAVLLGVVVSGIYFSR